MLHEQETIDTVVNFILIYSLHMCIFPFKMQFSMFCLEYIKETRIDECGQIKVFPYTNISGW